MWYTPIPSFNETVRLKYRDQEVVISHFQERSRHWWKAEVEALNCYTLDLTEREALERIKMKVDRALDKPVTNIDVPVKHSWQQNVTQPPRPK